MTDDAKAVGAVDVRSGVLMIAARLEQQVEQISRAIRIEIEDQIPELRVDARMIEMLGASTLANVETILAALQRDVPVESVDAPAAALDYGRRAAQHDIAVGSLIRGYRLGQRRMTEWVFEELRALGLGADTRIAVIEVITTVVFEYIDRVTQQVVAEYEGEREHWLQNQNSIRAMRVRDVLSDGAAIDCDSASAAIGYPLEVQHLAVILWYQETEAADGALARLQQFTAALAATVGCCADPLFAAADQASAWVWLPLRYPPGNLTAQVRDYARPRQDSLNIAVGAVGSGVEGFRRSHRQAQRVRAAVLARGCEPRDSARVLAVATDSEMMTAAILGAGIGEVREWVADVLGALATQTDEDAVLREALRVYLRSGPNPESAAKELNLTFNTLRSRVERAGARRGRPIDDRTDVELALSVCQSYGPPVLRPA